MISIDNGSTESFMYNALGQQAERVVASPAGTFETVSDAGGTGVCPPAPIGRAGSAESRGLRLCGFSTMV